MGSGLTIDDVVHNAVVEPYRRTQAGALAWSIAATLLDDRPVMSGSNSMIRKAFLRVLTLHVIGLPMILLSHIILARMLSVSEFGIFTFTISLVTVLSIPVSGGLPMLLTREVAGYARNTNWAAYRTLVLSAHAWVATLGVILGIGLVTWLLISGSPRAGSMIVAALLLPLLGFNGIRSGILKGLGHPALSEAPVQVVQPALLILGYLALGALGLTGVSHALWWYLTAVLVVFLAASLMLMRVQPVALRSTTGDATDLPRWRKAILPFTMLAAATTISTQIGIILVGVLGSADAVAQMGVAQRGAQLVVVPLVVINAILGPHFVSAIQSQTPGELRSVARHAARLTLLVSLPIGLVLLVFGRSLIGLTFGSPYDAHAYLPMAILVVGQLVSVSLGSGGILLSMGSHEKHALYSQSLSLLVIATVCALLIGPYGAIGAALGVACGIVSAKLYAYVMVRRLFGVSPAII